MKPDSRFVELQGHAAALLLTRETLRQKRAELGEVADSHIDALTEQQQVEQAHAHGTDNPLVQRQFVNTTGEIAALRARRERLR